mgnify:CR=1 FL=1
MRDMFRALALLAVLVLAGLLVVSVYASDEPLSWVPWFEGTDEEYVQLKIEVVPRGAGNTYLKPGTYEIKRGETVVLQVVDVSSGYEFSHWEVNFVDYGSAPFKTLTLEGDAEVKAVFTRAASGEEAGYLVVDIVFYDKPLEPPVGSVTLWELGVSMPLTPVQVTPNQWHGQAIFKGVRVGKTYTVVVNLENGARGTYVNFWTVYNRASYIQWGLISCRKKMPKAPRSIFEPFEWPG